MPKQILAIGIVHACCKVFDGKQKTEKDAKKPDFYRS